MFLGMFLARSNVYPVIATQKAMRQTCRGHQPPQKPPQARADKQPSQPQERLRDELLRGEEPETKAPHDLTESGAFSCSRIRDAVRQACPGQQGRLAAHRSGCNGCSKTALSSL